MGFDLVEWPENRAASPCRPRADTWLETYGRVANENVNTTNPFNDGLDAGDRLNNEGACRASALAGLCDRVPVYFSDERG